MFLFPGGMSHRVPKTFFTHLFGATEHLPPFLYLRTGWPQQITQLECPSSHLKDPKPESWESSLVGLGVGGGALARSTYHTDDEMVNL